MDLSIIKAMEEDKHSQYMTDESRLLGSADSISFPESENDVIDIVNYMRNNKITITIQGARTGITGASVPITGHIMNMSKMDKVLNFYEEDKQFYITVEAGIILENLKKEIKRLNTSIFWPPDPTEQTATVGGVVSYSANGICSFLYGNTSLYIEALRVVLADGTVKVFKKDRDELSTKMQELDSINMLIGGEGMYAVITEVTLKLLKIPENIWGLCFFFERQENLFQFIAEIENLNLEQAKIAALEYIDRATIDLIESRKETNHVLKQIPDIDKNISSLVYLEIHGEEAFIEEIAGVLLEIAENCDCDTNKAWALSGEAEVEKMRVFRHAAPESINIYLDLCRQNYPNIHKLGTDISYSNMDFKTVLSNYEENLKTEGLTGYIFGHINEGHLHVNIVAKNIDEFEKAGHLMEKWFLNAVKSNNKAINEHGVGKVKKKMFNDFYPNNEIEHIKSVKSQIDPFNLFNPGNML